MRLIDADDLKAIRFHDLPYSQIVPADCDTDDKVSAYKLGWNDAIDAIVESVPTSVPTVDTIKVVRCKDCKYASPNGNGCTVYHFKRYETHNMSPDDFCSWAERRNDETD